ncbi:hypothetical protein [Anditalea andensis]|uniref:Uncharacterized protein n=1 Tax=Anditalea andensis TaxID=1048983 RepID=A0A074L4W0_9BACT|nr:hypothetical protein [Anditalea andensis]KEO74888.1 hypothetical protein EL17_04200 [Anditalea andensis]
MNGARFFFPIFLFLSVVVTRLHAQSENCKWVKTDGLEKGVYLDSLSIVPESILVKDAEGNHLTFSYGLTSGIFVMDDVVIGLLDSVYICYSLFLYDFRSVYSHRTLERDYDSAALFKQKKTKIAHSLDFREEIFPTPRLNKSGNLTRGISFGNKQHVFVNSSLNLQMEGELADNLYIRASIIDQQIPFQPEGNTMHLQDFDKVLIELYNDNIKFEAGDIVLQQRRSDFLRYYKNVQGLQFTSQYNIGHTWKATSHAAISIAKGKFASTELPIIEGVLGPYRIRGPQNERFIIVMADSERVFLDNRMLKRGYNYDYVIDYNQGEITFTANILITKYSRVRVDYEYAERNFTRSILTATHTQESNQASFYFNYYREQDNRDKPLFFEYSDDQIRLLSSVGDHISAALVDKVDSTAFDPKRIMYAKRKNSSPERGVEIFYEYSTDPDEAFFMPSFMDVGQGYGDYIRKQQLANGIQYEFVQPINGHKQGRFSIHSPLPAPNKKQMVTSGGDVKLGLHEEVYTEMAVSDNDINLYSDLDNDNNIGYALKVGIRSQKRQVSWLQGYMIQSMAELEYNSSNFSFIDRARYIEFDRDWNLDDTVLTVPTSDHLFSAQLEAHKNSGNLISYRVNLRNRGGILRGHQQLGRYNQQLTKRIFLINDIFTLKNDVRNLHADWFRYNGNVEYRSKILVPGYRLLLDRNKVSHVESDSVVSSANNFKEHQVYLISNDTLTYSFFAKASWREDQLPVIGEMLPYTKAFTAHYGINKKMGNHDIKGTFLYRKLQYLQIDLPEETTIMGRIDYMGQIINNAIRSELNYAIGNGRELRKEFVYLPVPTGEGTHTWRDDNEDGVQQLNEFYLAINPDEKNFIKIFVPTDDYIQAFNTVFNYRLNTKFPDLWKKESGVRAILQKFSSNTSLNVDKKITSSEFWDRVLPFSKGLGDENLISVRHSVRSSLFFNRSSAKYGFDLSLFDSRSKQLLSGGYEDLIQREWRLNTRINLNPMLNVRFLANIGKRLAASDFLENRNYAIGLKGYGPELSYQPTSTIRATGNYMYTGKLNVTNDEIKELALHHHMGLDVRFAKAIKTTLNLNLNYTYIDYNGQPNTPVGYEMLQALAVGTNFIWNFNWIQKIGQGLQMNMVYEGRNSEGLGKKVHIGRMQVSALF